MNDIHHLGLHPHNNVLEVAIHHAKDLASTKIMRGMPTVLRHAPADFLAQTFQSVEQGHVDDLVRRFKENTGHSTGTGLRIVQELNSARRFFVWRLAESASDNDRPLVLPPFRLPETRNTMSEVMPFEKVLEFLSISDAMAGTDLQSRLAVRGLLQLGLGLLESIQINLDLVDFERGEYVLNTPDGRLRLIPIPSDLLEIFSELRETGPVSIGTRLTPYLLNCHIASTAGACGLKDISAATLQRTFVYG